ncbi:LysR family transcriptional regulator [Acinetobacter tianfuensis]|uniref:LysR family transcriptional regulator n=1 Tax=Acinetobacter tianfuensis TaxID=2419603 RepID=A0A3A8E997_9GAMM|nr:LysR family transcriptional regulator [Acinetobacter tianfuensis]RKG31175.1 LysR family transcriptional regulator [Acinetobacter tianfuensis]
MELRQLRYFTAVADAQSITKAAEKLNIAQPPLTRHIQNLESSLGTKLFERESRPLQLTQAGHFFYLHAKQLLSNADEIKTMTQRIAANNQSLRIGFVNSLMYGVMPKIIHLFHTQHSDVHIELLEMNSHEQASALREGRIDIGFGRYCIADVALRRVLLRNESLVLAVHASHALAQQKQGIYLKQIAEDQLFLYPNSAGPNFATYLLQRFTECSLIPKKQQFVRDLQLALGRVACGVGICVVPQSAAALQLANVHYLPILDCAAVSPIYLNVRQNEDCEHINSLFDCIYQVYDLEAIAYERAVL